MDTIRRVPRIFDDNCMTPHSTNWLGVGQARLIIKRLGDNGSGCCRIHIVKHMLQHPTLPGRLCLHTNHIINRVQPTQTIPIGQEKGFRTHPLPMTLLANAITRQVKVIRLTGIQVWIWPRHQNITILLGIMRGLLGPSPTWTKHSCGKNQTNNGTTGMIQEQHGRPYQNSRYIYYYRTPV